MKTMSTLFCVIANNTSNNNTACDHIKQLLHHQHVYYFYPNKNCLSCLAHILNLTITAVMSILTCIATVETTTAIWEFNPMLAVNHVLGGCLDVVAAICIIAIKIQSTGQHIAYFNCLQADCGINPALTIPLHSNIWWGMADSMLELSDQLRQVYSKLTMNIDLVLV